MSIPVRGPWAWAWGANIAFLWALSIWGWLVDRSTLLALGTLWATWFVVQEAVGAWRNSVMDRNHPELARTYSQVMQMFAKKDKGSSFWQTLTGWDLFVTGNTIAAGVAVGYIVGQVWHPCIGWFVGAVVAGWNYGHWHNREKHG